MIAPADDAERSSHAFSPDTELYARYSRAWNSYGEPGEPGQVRGAPPASLDRAEQICRDCSNSCCEELDRHRVQHQQFEETRRHLLRRARPEPRIPHSFHENLWRMHAVLEALPALRQNHIKDRCSLSSTYVQLRASAQWRDDQRRRPERAQLDPLRAEVSRFAKALGQLDGVLDSVKRLMRGEVR